MCGVVSMCSVGSAPRAFFGPYHVRVHDIVYVHVLLLWYVCIMSRPWHIMATKMFTISLYRVLYTM